MVGGAQPLLWARGLTVTTTGLDRADKECIRQDVEAAGGRFSPNLSKRTTHLVTPEVVDSVSEKLAAATAGSTTTTATPGATSSGGRYKSLQVVSKCWVSACAGLRCRADESQFVPLLPPAAPHQQQSGGGGGGGGAPNASAGGGPQTPWVVHFSQLPDDSVYQQQPHQHPAAAAAASAQLLARQLHMQLSPITESFSQEQQQYNSSSSMPAGAAAAQGQRYQLAATPPLSLSKQGSLLPASVRESPVPSGGGAAAAAAAASRRTSAGGGGGAARGSWAGTESPRHHSRPSNLQLPAGGTNNTNSSSSYAAWLVSGGGPARVSSSSGGSYYQQQGGAAAGAVSAGWQGHPEQQQQQQSTWAAAGSPYRELQRGSSARAPAAAAEAAAAEAAAAEAQRRATTESLMHHSRLLQQQIQLPQHQQQMQQLSQQPQQQTPPAKQQQQQQPMGWPQHAQEQDAEQEAAAAVLGGCGGSGGVDELIAALQRATGDSRRVTSTPVPEYNGDTVAAAAAAGAPAATAAWTLGGSSTPSRQHGASGGSAGGAGGSSIESLLQSLRRLSDRTAPPAAPAAEDAATPCWQQQPRVSCDGAAGAMSAAAAAAPAGDSCSPFVGAMARVKQRLSLGSIREHEHGGNSSSAEHDSSCGRPLEHPQQQQLQQQQLQQGQRPEHLNHCFWGSGGGHPHSTADLAVEQAAAVPLPLSQEGASHAHGWQQQDMLLLQEQAAAEHHQQQLVSAGPPGSYSNVADLIAALPRATGDSRRNTGESRRHTAELSPRSAAAGATAADYDTVAAWADAAAAAAPDTRDAGRPHKPHLPPLKLPKERDGYASRVYAATAHGSGGSSSAGGGGGSGSGYPPSGSNATTSNSRSYATDEEQAMDHHQQQQSQQQQSPESINRLVNALQCIAAASQLQEAAVLDPAVAAAAQSQVAALETHMGALPPGSEYAQLVSRLSMELSEINKQASLGSLQDQQEQQMLQVQQQEQQSHSPELGMLGAAPAPEEQGAGAYEQWMGQQSAALSSGSQGLQQLVEALRRATAERDGQGEEAGGLQVPPSPSPRPSPVPSSAAGQGAYLQQQQQQHHHQEQQQQPQALPGEQPGSGDGCSLADLLLAVQSAAARGQQQPLDAAAVLPASYAQHQQHQHHQQQQQPQQADAQQAGVSAAAGGGEPISASGTSNVHELIAALQRATDGRNQQQPAGQQQQQALPPGTNSRSVEQLLQQLAQCGVASQQAQESAVAEQTPAAVVKASSQHSLRQGRELRQEQLTAALDAAAAASQPASLQALHSVAASPAAHQQPQLSSWPEAAAVTTTTPPRGSPAAQLGAAAGDGCHHHLAGMVAVFDRQVPSSTRQQLTQALLACGASVLPGTPHLGCGANTIVAEPDAAAGWLHLLLDIVTPAWLAKTLRQQQQEDGSMHIRMVRLSPDAAKAASLQVQQHRGAAPCSRQPSGGMMMQPAPAGAGDAATHTMMTAPHLEAEQQRQHWGGGNGESSPTGQQHVQPQQQRQQTPVLVVPRGYLAVSAGSSSGEPLQMLQAQQHQQHQQQVMRPAALLTYLLWSVGQPPRIVADEELEAVLLPGCGDTAITLLLPQGSSSALGHAAVQCSAADAGRGLTCGDVLTAIHAFYQQDVVVEAQSGDGGSGSRVRVKRLQLLGHRLMFEGLSRVTRDPCSSVYEACLT